MAYLFQLNFYLLLVYGFYWLLLKNETFHQQNRLLLLGGIFLAILMPMGLVGDFQLFQDQTRNNNVQIFTLPFQVVSAVLSEPSQLGFNWQSVVFFVYCLGVILMFIKLIINILNLRKLLSQGLTKQAFSFGRKVFVDPSLPQQTTIKQHEAVHAAQLHTLDLLLIELLLVFNWFNPVLYLLKKALKNLHEFLADDAASQQLGKAKYARLLLSQQFGVPEQVLVSSFYETSTLKQRMIMLARKKSAKTALLKYGLCLPLFVMMVLVSSSFVNKRFEQLPIVKQLEATAEEVVDLGLKSPELKSEKPSQVLENKANMVEIADVLAEIIPQAKADTAVKPLEGGKIFIQDGGKVIISDKNDNITDKKPLVFVDGKEWIGKNIDAIDPSNIASMEVIKGENATKLYGERAKDGAILIKMKDKKIEFGAEKTPPMHQPAEISRQLTDEEEVFVTVEESAEFPGGINGLTKYLSENIQYPEPARAAQVEGMVFMQFVIGKDGSIRDITLLKGIGFGCDEETKRVIKSMPAWKPGKQNGKVVNMRYTMPVEFKLSKKK
jgi:TonB family protein